jgi:hypothetical protein
MFSLLNNDMLNLRITMSTIPIIRAMAGYRVPAVLAAVKIQGTAWTAATLLPVTTERAAVRAAPVTVAGRIMLAVQARLEPYDPPKKLEIANVLGQISFQDCPGALVFEIEGKEYRLDPQGSPEDKSWFLNFTDETSGRETYGAGRYLVLDAPDENGITYIDFNKAYNPPCAFSPYATCPLPPKQNHLNVEITAGEKDYGHH